MTYKYENQRHSGWFVLKKSLLQEKNILCQCYKRNAFQKRRWILIEIHVSKWSYEFNGKNDMIRFGFDIQ